MSQRWSLNIRVLRGMHRQIHIPEIGSPQWSVPKGWAGRVHWWHPDPYRTSRSGSACIPPAPGRTGWHRSEIWHNLPQKPGMFDGWGTLVAWGKTWSGMQLIIWEVYDVVMCLKAMNKFMETMRNMMDNLKSGCTVRALPCLWPIEVSASAHPGNDTKDQGWPRHWFAQLQSDPWDTMKSSGLKTIALQLFQTMAPFHRWKTWISLDLTVDSYDLYISVWSLSNR